MYKSAVVFAYHEIGVRGILVLLARGVDIRLVVSHAAAPEENIWFASVSQICAERGIACISPAQPDATLLARISQLAPDFIFSFYYRHMLAPAFLEIAKDGAYNLHGSLLPKYRGRVPVNWAVLHGETETGVSLHEMNAKPDAGDIIDQSSVPILPDDTAYEVFRKLVVASEQVLWRSLPLLMTGNFERKPNELALGSYFGGRTPEQGKIDWQQPAQQVYNLHRAVAPPYPGAYTELAGKRLVIGGARMMPARQDSPGEEHTLRYLPPGLNIQHNMILGVCGDGNILHIRQLLCDGEELALSTLAGMLAGSVAGDAI